MIGIRAATEIVAKQEHRLPEGISHAQLHHDALIRWGSIHNGKESIGLPYIPQTLLGHPIGPPRLLEIHITVAGKRLPHQKAKPFKSIHEAGN